MPTSVSIHNTWISSSARQLLIPSHLRSQYIATMVRGFHVLSQIYHLVLSFWKIFVVENSQIWSLPPLKQSSIFFPFSASFLASGHCYTSPIIYVHYTCPNHHQTNVHFRRRKRKPTLLSPMKRFRFMFTSTNPLNHFFDSIMLHSYSYP